MKDLDLVSLCIYEEAWKEPDEGKAAVARVIYNRIKNKYESDGTVDGTILRYDQFSWAWFAFINGKYIRISDTHDQALSIAEYKLKHAPSFVLQRCAQLAISVKNNDYHGDLYDHLTDQTVLYLNPNIIENLPDWASSDKYVCTIQNHKFYHA